MSSNPTALGQDVTYHSKQLTQSLQYESNAEHSLDDLHQVSPSLSGKNGLPTREEIERVLHLCDNAVTECQLDQEKAAITERIRQKHLKSKSSIYSRESNYTISQESTIINDKTTAGVQTIPDASCSLQDGSPHAYQSRVSREAKPSERVDRVSEKIRNNDVVDYKALEESLKQTHEPKAVRQIYYPEKDEFLDFRLPLSRPTPRTPPSISSSFSSPSPTPQLHNRVFSRGNTTQDHIKPNDIQNNGGINHRSAKSVPTPQHHHESTHTAPRTNSQTETPSPVVFRGPPASTYPYSPQPGHAPVQALQYRTSSNSVPSGIHPYNNQISPPPAYGDSQRSYSRNMYHQRDARGYAPGIGLRLYTDPAVGAPMPHSGVSPRAVQSEYASPMHPADRPPSGGNNVRPMSEMVQESERSIRLRVDLEGRLNLPNPAFPFPGDGLRYNTGDGQYIEPTRDYGRRFRCPPYGPYPIYKPDAPRSTTDTA